MIYVNSMFFCDTSPRDFHKTVFALRAMRFEYNIGIPLAKIIHLLL